MPYLVKEKLLFLHVPKTGGTTIMNYFAKRDDNENNLKLYYAVDNLEWSHATYDMCKNELKDKIDNLYKFMIVRNPYDKIVSEYFYRKKYGYANGFNSRNMSFEIFVKRIQENFHFIKRMSHINKSHFILQKNFYGKDVEIFYFEQFDKIVNYLNKKFSINIENKIENTSDHSNYRFYYNEETANIILNLYKEDFDFFGYSKNVFSEKFI